MITRCVGDAPTLASHAVATLRASLAAAVAGGGAASGLSLAGALGLRMLAPTLGAVVLVGLASGLAQTRGLVFAPVRVDLGRLASGEAWRLGLTTQYGWEGGTFRQGGDAFLAQSASLGGQVPGQVFTPFFEVYAGGGLMQRTHKDIMLNAAATAYGQLGVDVGSEIFLARYFCLSGALGYIHAGNGFVKSASFGSFSVDTISFKLGVGL